MTPFLDSAPRAFSDEPERPLWKPGWRTFSAWEGAATIAAGAGTGILFMMTPPTDARWEGGILFDDSLRDGMRLKSIVCANHRAMPLWGDPIADAGACALATSGAMFTGVTPIMADRHYTTDVLAGFGVGFAVPTLLHYTGSGKGTRPDVSLSVSPGAPCTGACLKLAGSF